MHGIELRGYFQDQQHVFMTYEDAEALTADIMAKFPVFAKSEAMTEFYDPDLIKAEASFPLNARYIKPILTRVANDAKRTAARVHQWRQNHIGNPPSWLSQNRYTPATNDKHARIAEVRDMYDEINRLRCEIAILKRHP